MKTIRPIGIFHSCYPQKFGTPRQPGVVPESTGFIEIHAEFQPQYSLQGLETFSHLWVVFDFHEVKDYQFRAKIHPPRLEGESMGVFATRSPHRPNTLGLSLVKIVAIEKNGIQVREVDIIQGTPVYDIKPYLPEFEIKTQAKGGWPLTTAKNEFQFTWSEEAKSILTEEQKRFENIELLQLIEHTLQQDPRPLAFKKDHLENKQYRSNHYVRIHHLDVGFYFRSKYEIVIEQIRLF